MVIPYMLGTKSAVNLELLLAGIENRVGIVEPDVYKKWIFAVLFNKPDSVIDDELARSASLTGLPRLATEFELGAVPRINSAFIDTIGGGLRRAVSVPKVPLAKMCRVVPGVLKEASIGQSLWIKPIGHSPCMVHLVIGKVAMNTMSSGKLTGHHGRPAWGTHTGADVELGE